VRAKIKTGSVYDVPSKSDGVRVLVTRYWPRGVKRDAVEHWFRDLAPEKGLIRDWKQGRIDWEEFKSGYLAGFSGGGGEETTLLLEELRSIVRASGAAGVTLLCVCRDAEQCHRSLLKSLLEG